MQGLSIESLKRHKAWRLNLRPAARKAELIQTCAVTAQLIPLYVCTGIGCAMAVFYTLRLATRNPDVSWNKKSNPEPWEEYRTKQYKFYSPNRDYSKEESPAPKY